MHVEQPPTKRTATDLAREEKEIHDGGAVSEEASSNDGGDITLGPSHANLPKISETSATPKDDSDAESVGGQRNTMSTKRLMVAIPALSVCLFVSFVDQTSVSTATPAIAGDLNTGTATSWIGTSFLIASTAFQLINGRLSDIFGRKTLLLICLALMALGDLGCGFAQTPGQLFALRSIAGIGGGGINSLVMIIVSDITTLQNRGKYQGTCHGRRVLETRTLTCKHRLAWCHNRPRQWRWSVSWRCDSRRRDMEMGFLDDPHHDTSDCCCHSLLFAFEAPIWRLCRKDEENRLRRRRAQHCIDPPHPRSTLWRRCYIRMVIAYLHRRDCDWSGFGCLIRSV